MAEFSFSFKVIRQYSLCFMPHAPDFHRWFYVRGSNGSKSAPHRMILWFQNKLRPCLAVGLCHPPVSKLLLHILKYSFLQISIHHNLLIGLLTFPLRSSIYPTHKGDANTSLLWLLYSAGCAKGLRTLYFVLLFKNPFSNFNK